MKKNYIKIKELCKRNKFVDLMAAPLTVAVILLIVYAIKGVYPFGENTVSYYDMSGSYIPIYTYFWDVLHGKSGLYLNWYSGMGVSMADVVGIFLFFPTNLFFLFTTRDGILYAMSFFVLIKLALCAFSMSFYYKKHYTGFTGMFCSGIIYAFCGFAIQYYTNIFYFDLVLLFPLIVWSFENLLLEHKYKIFILLMIFAFFTNVQLVFMVGIYLLFKGYFLLKKVPVDNRSKSIALFAASVITSMLIAAFVLVPSISQTVQSTRSEVNSGFDYKNVMGSVYCLFRRQKQFMLYGSEIAIGLLLLTFIRGKEIIKKYYNNILMILILCIPIIHEGINRLWHAGSYKHFPLRFGYMITFECMVFVADYCANEEFRNKKYIGKIAKLVGMAAIPFAGYILFDFCRQFTLRGIDDLPSYYSYWVYLLTFAGLYFICFIMESPQSRKGSIVFLVLIQAVCGCYGFIAPKQAGADYYRNKSLFSSIELKNKLEHRNDFSKRIKSDPGKYEANDAMMYQYPSLGAWLYGMPGNTEKELENNMGYDGMTSYLFDTGGTVFTDALLGVDKIAFADNPDPLLYSDSNSESVYLSKYTLPFGIVSNASDLDDESVLFVHQNNIFKQMTGLSNELIDISDAGMYVSEEIRLSDDEVERIHKELEEKSSLLSDFSMKDEGIVSESATQSEENDNQMDEEEYFREYRLEIPIEKKTTVYIVAEEGFTGEVAISVNGELKPIEGYTMVGLYKYPNTVRSGILALGTYEDEKAIISLYTYNDKLDGLSVGMLDINTMTEGFRLLREKQELNTTFFKNGMRISGQIYESGTLFIPISYSENWRVKLNGVPLRIKPYINSAFIAVDVAEGEADLQFTYVPAGIRTGISLSVTGVILFIFLSLYTDKISFEGKGGRIADKILIYGYTVVIFALFVSFYLVPIYIKMAL